MVLLLTEYPRRVAPLASVVRQPAGRGLRYHADDPISSYSSEFDAGPEGRGMDEPVCNADDPVSLD